ncbi:hypothetical protein D3C87_1316660 [compost metagenome]
MFHVERPNPFSPLEGFDFGTVESNFGTPAELQQITGDEIDKQQSGPRINQQVAQGIEKQVAGEVRNGQAIAFHVNET